MTGSQQDFHGCGRASFLSDATSVLTDGTIFSRSGERMVDHNVISSHHVTRQASLSSKSTGGNYQLLYATYISNQKKKGSVPPTTKLKVMTHVYWCKTHTHISVLGDNTCRGRAQMSLKNRPYRSVANCTQYPSTVKRDHPITCLRQLTFNTREARSNFSNSLIKQRFREYVQDKRQTFLLIYTKKKTIFYCISQHTVHFFLVLYRSV